jgi:hypothetical protein
MKPDIVQEGTNYTPAYPLGGVQHGCDLIKTGFLVKEARLDWYDDQREAQSKSAGT